MTPSSSDAPLGSLQVAAEALNCDLVYAVVPRATTLNEMVHGQALRKAREIVGPVTQTMTLEDQRVDSARNEELVEQLASELVDSRRLWS